MERLPQESMEHIASFLSREDIARLKLTSYVVSMACLAQMDKYSVGVVNVNEFIDDAAGRHVDDVGLSAREPVPLRALRRQHRVPVAARHLERAVRGAAGGAAAAVAEPDDVPLLRHAQEPPHGRAQAAPAAALEAAALQVRRRVAGAAAHGRVRHCAPRRRRASRCSSGSTCNCRRWCRCNS